MPLPALVFALAAAVLHAVYNLILARSDDTDATVAAAMVVGVGVLVPIAILRWRVEAEAWPYVAVSSALELVYFAMLALAYRRADLSLIYPIARGLAPVLVLVVGFVLLGQHVSLLQGLGVVVVAVGVVLVRGLRGAADLVDLGLAGALALAICSYTLVDQQGLRFADPLAYLVLVVGIPGSIFFGFVVARGGPRRVRAAAGWPVLAGGIGVVAAYGLVLAALTMTAAAGVAAVREVSVVIATGLAAVVLHERVGAARLAGAVVVVTGVALIVAG